MIRVSPYTPEGDEWKSFTAHPAADILPLLDLQEFDLLKDSIREKGLMQAIALSEDHLILDGRNRYLACAQLNIKPRFEIVSGVEDPVAYVVDRAMVGRQLTKDQMVFYIIEYVLPAEKKLAAGRVGGRGKKLRDNCPGVSEEGRAADQAAQRFGISGRTIRRVEEAFRKGVPELRLALRDGKMNPSALLALSKLPENTQYEILTTANPKSEWAKYRRTVDPKQLVAQVDAIMATGANYPTAISRVAEETGRSRKMLGHLYSLTKDVERSEPVSLFAEQYGEMAISQLRRIEKNDPKKQEVFDRVKQWIASQEDTNGCD